MRRTRASLWCPLLLAFAAQAFAQSATPEPTAAASDKTASTPASPESAESPQAEAAPATDADALAKQLANPVASLISVPFQFNYDTPVGDDGERVLLNIQPVIPIRISENWNLISRTILPVIDQHDVIPDRHQSGLGDITQTLFFSPAELGKSGVIWGAGPVFLLPTGTDHLGNKTWAAGPSFVVLRQRKGWTIGALVNHLVDVGGGDDRIDISSTFLQPFISKGFSGGRTLTLNTESTYNWHAHEWTVPVNLMLAKVTKIGHQAISFQGGVRGYAKTPGRGPDWGLRFNMTLLFPK